MQGERQYVLPDFIAIGPPRTGTTWLHQALAGHADLPAGVKETQFFNHHYTKGIQWYADHFRHASGERPVGEICPYFEDPNASARIKVHIPLCKLITCFRDPVDRAYSHYKLLRAYVWVRGSFEEVIENRPHIDRANRYAANLKRWFDAFGRDNLLVTWYEDLLSDPQGYVDRFCDFTGIARFKLPALRPGNHRANEFRRAPKSRHLAQNARHVLYYLRERRAYRLIEALRAAGVWAFCFGRGEPYPPLTPEQDARVRRRYVAEVEALEQLLQCDLSHWKRPRWDVSARRSAGKGH